MLGIMCPGEHGREPPGWLLVTLSYGPFTQCTWVGLCEQQDMATVVCDL